MTVSTPKPVPPAGAAETQGARRATEVSADPDPLIDPDLPAAVGGKAFGHLVTRSATYNFIAGLPADARVQMVQAKVTVAATDNTVTLTWDRKARLPPSQVMTAFEFLDQQLSGGDWSLRFDQLHFLSGKALLQWQIDASCKIDPTQVTQ